MRKLNRLKAIKAEHAGETAEVGILSPPHRGAVAAWIILVCTLAGLSAAQAQPSSATAPAHDGKAGKQAPVSPTLPDDALPSGDTKSGVLKPPDVDPGMSKAVPDVDPAMDNPPPGKVPIPEKSDPPKVQPR